MAIQRHIFEKILGNLSSEKIQIITGPRYVGKHYLINSIIRNLVEEKSVPEDRIFHFGLDDVLIQLEFIDDFNQFIAMIEKRIGQELGTLSFPIYFFFDQIQNYTSLFELISKLFKINPSQIKIILTSSINPETDKSFQSKLAPISKLYYLYPLSFNELIRNDVAPLNGESVLHTIFKGEFDLEYFEYIRWIVEPYKDAVLAFINDYVMFGGLPVTYESELPKERRETIKNYLRQYFQRDIRMVYQIADLKKFDSILKIMGANNGNILNLLNLCDYYQLNRNTIRKYTSILHDTFILEFVQPFLKEKVKKPIMRTPKIYFLNPGLVNYLNGITSFEQLQQSTQLEKALQAALYINLKNTMHQFGSDFEISFLRDYQEHELDFLVSTPKKLIPVGVTFESEQKKVKIKTFKYYLRYCQQISDGVIFGKFDKIELLEMRGSRLFLLPLWMLW